MGWGKQCTFQCVGWGSWHVDDYLSVMQCGAVWCSVMQCAAVCCSVLQCWRDVCFAKETSIVQKRRASCAKETSYVPKRSMDVSSTVRRAKVSRSLHSIKRIQDTHVVHKCTRLFWKKDTSILQKSHTYESVVRLTVDEMFMKKWPTYMKRDTYIYKKRPIKETHTRDALSLSLLTRCSWKWDPHVCMKREL